MAATDSKIDAKGAGAKVARDKVVGAEVADAEGAGADVVTIEGRDSRGRSLIRAPPGE